MTQEERTAVIGQLVQERSAVSKDLKELEAEASRVVSKLKHLASVLGTPEFLFLDGEGMMDEDRRRIAAIGSPGDYTVSCSTFPAIEKIKILCHNIREKKSRLQQLTDQLKGFGVEF